MLHVKISNLYIIKSEYEETYIDLAFFPRDKESDLDILLFEIKYIKKDEASKETIAEKCHEAMEQLQQYGSAKEFSGKKVTAWAIVFAGEKYVERVRGEIATDDSVC